MDPYWLKQLHQWDNGGQVELRAVLLYCMGLQEALDEASRVTKQIVQTVKQAEEEASSPFRAS